jgi:hypothetical protein
MTRFWMLDAGFGRDGTLRRPDFERTSQRDVSTLLQLISQMSRIRRVGAPGLQNVLFAALL